MKEQYYCRSILKLRLLSKTSFPISYTMQRHPADVYFVKKIAVVNTYPSSAANRACTTLNTAFPQFPAAPGWIAHINLHKYCHVEHTLHCTIHMRGDRKFTSNQ